MRLPSFLTAVIASAAIAQAAMPTEQQALDFLYGAMPLSDSAMKTEQYYRDNVAVALKAAEELPWVSTLPENLWMHFVLPVRSNNEALDDFRTTYYAELRDRVKGLSMREAALEVNHWLHEKATYEPSDSRTSGPMSTIRTSRGRCGEESVLGVAAMRTVGIPARQVYTPRWAHTDDNHAWIEVWVDGKWYFMGACEPEPELNRAWFNSPASRGMMMHTRVFGDYNGAEQILSHHGNITEINVTENYVPVRDNKVRVLNSDGTPAASTPVSFRVYNYAEFYPLATVTTDSAGYASLRTGCGDMLAWASDGRQFGFAVVNSPSTTLTMSHPIGSRISVDIDITPPAENPIPSSATDEQIADNARRMAIEDSIRNSYTATFYTPLPDHSPRVAALLVKARGNWREIQSFIDSTPQARMADALAMLETVSEKDLRDTPAAIFRTTLQGTRLQPGNPLYHKYILNPRIANELLSDYRLTLPVLSTTATGIITLLADSLRIDNEANAYRVPITPADAWRTRTADARSRDILFVAMCRNAGIASRINEVSGKPQYHDGREWVNADFATASDVISPRGRLTASYSPIPHVDNPQYYRHFTISDVSSGTPRLQDFDENEAYFSTTLADTLNLDCGYYLLTSGSRMASGKVLAHLEFFNIKPDSLTGISLRLRDNTEDIRVIGNMDCERMYTDASGTSRSILSTTGRGYFLIAMLGNSDEPSNHAITELASITSELNRWGRPVLILKPEARQRTELSGIKALSYGTDTDGSIADMMRRGTSSHKNELPIIAIADSFGRIIFISEGYDTNLAGKIKSIIPRI